jgi:hypothetical protein
MSNMSITLYKEKHLKINFQQENYLERNNIHFSKLIRKYLDELIQKEKIQIIELALNDDTVSTKSNRRQSTGVKA